MIKNIERSLTLLAMKICENLIKSLKLRTVAAFIEKYIAKNKEQH